MQFVITSENLCNCPFCNLHIITNMNQPNEKLIAKIYQAFQLDYFNNENQICQILTNQNNENIIRLINNNNIQLIGLEEFGNNAHVLIFDFLNHGKLFQYLENQISNFTEDMVKYIGYKLIRAIQTMHINNIAHTKLTLDNIMMNQSFDPIIIHFREARLGPNNNSYFFEDLKEYAKILAKLITNGKFINIEVEKNSIGKIGYIVIDYAGRKYTLKEFSKKFFKPDNVSMEFRNFFKLLISTQNLNFDVLLNHPWFQGININGNNDLRDMTRQYFAEIFEKRLECNDISCTERYDLSEAIEEEDEEDEKDQNFSLYNSTMRGEAKEDLSQKFKKLLIKETKYKPMGVSYEYLILEISNYNQDNSFLKKFMSELYSYLEENKELEGFIIKPEKINFDENKYLSFFVNINKIIDVSNFNEDDFTSEENLVPEEVVNEFEENEQSLMINFELVKYIENNQNEIKENKDINGNKEKFYLLFNFSQGEISYYYQCVKIFKEKAKSILKKFFKKN